MSDNINVEVKRKNPSIPPKNLRELTKQVSEIEGTIDDINESVEEAEQDVNEIKRAIDNSDDFVIRDNKFKRKNKAYNPARYSGLGEIYLEKNETFLGREFDELVVNVDVPDPTAIAETFEGLVYDRQKKEFLVYELVDSERVYYAEWIKFDKWESVDDYIPEAGYNFICEADGKAYKWNEENTPDLVQTIGTYGNVLIQNTINVSNTIYHISYDYDLNGKEINIPENCALLFEGGSFRNGKIVLNNCSILPSYNSIVNSNLNLTGMPKAGTIMWDSNNNMPIWSNGIVWVDATGASI
jgi:hypothetical protein